MVVPAAMRTAAARSLARSSQRLSLKRQVARWPTPPRLESRRARQATLPSTLALAPRATAVPAAAIAVAAATTYGRLAPKTSVRASSTADGGMGADARDEPIVSRLRPPAARTTALGSAATRARIALDVVVRHFGLRIGRAQEHARGQTDEVAGGGHVGDLVAARRAGAAR